jgi:hypothetical protein
MAKTTSRTVQSRHVKRFYTNAGRAAAAARKVAVKKATMRKKKPGYITELI